MAEKGKIPSIPSVHMISDVQLKSILGPVKETIEIREGLRGSIEDRHVTVQDLIDLGLISKGDMDKVLRNR